MASPVVCFYAYPDKPDSSVEVIENAINHINEMGPGVVEARGWRTLSVTGKPIIDEVCAAIEKCALFLCDLTYLNRNVLFELGYAIVRNKRVWITLDPSIEHAKTNYGKLELLSTIGYAPYTNSRELAGRFFAGEPFADLESTVYDNVIRSIVESQPRKPSLFYLKSEFNTEASLELSRLLKRSKLPLTVDDPQEFSSLPLTWYAHNAYYAFAVVVHLLSEDHDSSLLQDAKYSLVSGMAYGFNKSLMILAHAPYTPPIDYRDLLYVHKTAAECESFVESQLPAIKDHYFAQLHRSQERRTRVEAAVALQRIDLGEYIAENEQYSLLDYFIVTAPYNEALKTSQYVIYAGRKGSGKTANLYKIADELEQHRDNHVCVIKPVDYDLEGVVQLLTSIVSQAERGYLTESMWKFLIYTELARTVDEVIQSQPPYYERTSAEADLVKYVEEHEDLIKTDLTVRMERVVDKLLSLGASHSVAEQRTRVSEILHGDVLADLRTVLGKVLEDREKVCLLVDNLDKAWRKQENLGVLSDFLFGLLSASQDIPVEFQKSGPAWRPVNLSLIVFLRSDILAYIIAEAREGDKLSFRRINWNDPDLLQRVIEERFVNSLGDRTSAEHVWQEFFDTTVKGIATEDYIVSRILPRPRDIIYFTKAALAHAVNHKHTTITEEDILQAEEEYSQHAYRTLLAETEIQFGADMEALLIEFAGANEIVTRIQIEDFLNRANLPEDKVDHAIELLVDARFLGLETDMDTYQFVYDESKEKVLKALARRTAERVGQERFRIHVAFHSFLDIRSESPSRQ